MQFQMRQERQLCRHLRERLFSLFQGRMAFLIYGKLRKIARVSKSFVFFANYGGSEGGLSPAFEILRKNVRVSRIFAERQTGSV